VVILVVGTGCSARIDRPIATGVTLKCGSGADPDQPFFATIGGVEQAEGRRVALITINDDYSPNYRGWSFLPIDGSALANSCAQAAASRPLSPSFKASADEWRKNLQVGNADAFITTLQQSYETFRFSARPEGYAGPPLALHDKLWSAPVCVPHQSDCVSRLKRPLLGRLFNS
jgi:hypothetical protein